MTTIRISDAKSIKDQLKKGDRVRFWVQGSDQNKGTIVRFKRDGSIEVRQLSSNPRFGTNWFLNPRSIIERLTPKTIKILQPPPRRRGKDVGPRLMARVLKDQ